MRGRASRRTRRVACIAAAGVLLAAAAGCGSDGDEDDGAAASTRTEEAASGDGLRGEPVVVGVLVATNNNINAVPEEISTAKAAAGYINDELGGIDGRPLQVEICETRQSNDSVVACANELIGKDPVAVVAGGDIGMVAGMPVFESAKVPVIGGAVLYPNETLGPPPVYRSLMVGFVASLLPAFAYYSVETFDADKVVVVSQEGSKDLPDPFINTVMEKLGAPPVEFVGAPPTAPDLTPYFQTAAAKDPDVVAVFGLPCVPVLQAFRASGSKAKLLQPAQCAQPDTLEQAGDLAEGSYYVYGNRVPELDPDHPDVEVFTAALERYAPDEQHATTDFGIATFQGVMNVADLARELPDGKVTAAAMQKAVRATEDQKNWLGLSGTYSCSPPPIVQFPGFCSAEAALAQLTDGELRHAVDGHVDLAPLLSAG